MWALFSGLLSLGVIYAALHFVAIVVLAGVFAHYVRSRSARMAAVWVLMALGVLFAVQVGRSSWSVVDSIAVVLGGILMLRFFASDAPPQQAAPAAVRIADQVSTGPTQPSTSVAGWWAFLFGGALAIGALVQCSDKRPDARPQAQQPVAAPAPVAPAPAAVPKEATQPASAARRPVKRVATTLRQRPAQAPAAVQPEPVEQAPSMEVRPAAAQVAKPFDAGGHPGFPPGCRWVTPTKWSCQP